MIRIAGVAGSLRSGSYNAALLRAADALAPEGCSVESLSIRGVPLYDGDLEAREGVPAIVTTLKERIATADGLLLASPEYNGSLPGVMKNALDWLSRPPADTRRVFSGKPVGLMGATPGLVGTRLAQTAWLPVLRALGTRPWFGAQLYVSGAARVFDEAGELVDEALRERLGRYLQGFVEYIGEAPMS